MKSKSREKGFVPFRGPKAEFSSKTLLSAFHEPWAQNPYGASAKLKHMWRHQLMAAEDDFIAGHSKLCFTKSLNCESSLLFSSGASRYNCELSWACPFCYGRKLVWLYEFMERQSFQVDCDIVGVEVGDLTKDWKQAHKITRKHSHRHKGLLTWRFLTPTLTGITLTLLHMWPDYRTVDRDLLLSKLTESLAYSPSWLTCEPARVPYLLSILSGQRCCSLSGIYRNYNDSDCTVCPTN